MKTEWQHFSDTGLGTRKPVETSDLYLTRHQIQSYCIANGYDAAVLRGHQCDFYKGDCQKLFHETKAHNGYQLFLNFSGAALVIDEEWIVIDRSDILEDDLSLGRTASDIDSSCDYWDEVGTPLPISNTIGNSGGVVMSIFENQRWIPIIGWAPSLKARWTNAFTDETLSPPSKITSPSGTRWSGNWEVDHTCGDLDDGWEYSGRRIAGFLRKARRRKWIRTHVPLVKNSETKLINV